MSLMGYKLVRTSDGTVLEQWGGAVGSCPGVPNVIRCESGDHVHCPSLDTDYGGVTLIGWDEPPPDLAATRADYTARIDTDAETQRLRYISPGAGMAMTYQEKHAQARAVIDLGESAANALSEPQAADLYPTLSASIGIESPTLWGCAQLVIQRYELFADVSRGIERARIAGKKAVLEAATVDDVISAYGAIQWPA